MLFVQSAMTLTFVCKMVQEGVRGRVEWKCVLEECGELCVTTTGIHWTRLSPVNS